MRYTEEEMELMNEYETLRSREAELDLYDQMRLTQWERNALEYSMEFVNEEMGSLRAEYIDLVEGRGR
jgi:hypothetical protein